MRPSPDRPTCPACGSDLSTEDGSQGLCLGCLMELALESPSLLAEPESSEDAPTLDFSEPEAAEEALTVGFAETGSFAAGRVHGERYRIRMLLGRGGMGEVWRAYDLKLRLDVALKSLRDELVTDPRALESLRQEVRTAREVVSSNVCRVFDLEEIEGHELISMEYVDGTTLQEIVKQRGPLELNEAREIASQFLAGLEAIHEAGLVHRDIKPENLMITRTGRVVVMDFGIAKALQEGRGGRVAGTPAYMSPEQTRGEALDARADLFSAGVVLAEMVEPGGLRSFEDRKRVWEGIHQPEPQLSPTPWAKVVAKAVAPDREQRFASASALARALEEVTLRAAGDEDARPYPGLAAFQQEDAQYFFGRELEVEALWKKLRRPQLMAVIGPSGAGKSSFLRAGLLATLPADWSFIVTAPGSRPFASLAEALSHALPGDSTTVDRRLGSEEPVTAVELLSEWRAGHQHALLVLDQFEELFTQNPPEVQAAFAELIGRLPLEADIHVLLSMRDDFLFHCQGHESLAPVFADLTPIGPPTGAALRRAIVQPALKCGYRFEDESIVEEMLSEVEGERGSLPMVAFTVARLWQLRDRDRGLLTRQAYEQSGGVGGALAQHAEATLERIGSDQFAVVRELFRNLVTAEGTRATRDREELLSIFSGEPRAAAPARGSDPPGRKTRRAKAPGRSGDQMTYEQAEKVLDALVDARLLTSYEVSVTEDEKPRTRIEIIHESLLSNWPRLVRWQFQDADSAQLRDQLRQAAQAWLDRGRPSDLLWSGTSYQEYELWRQRYPGGLTAAEEEFTRQMAMHAKRRQRRRRATTATVFVILLGVLAVVFASRQEARRQAHRAEANQLLALGRLEIENNTTGALAYAIASLERADDPVTRLFALETLWRGPTASIPEGYPGFELWGSTVDFSPDGRWLVTGRVAEDIETGPELRLWAVDGSVTDLSGLEGGILPVARFDGDSERIVAKAYRGGPVQLWNMSEGRWLGPLPTETPPGDFRLVSDKRSVYTFTSEGRRTRVEAWPLAGGEPRILGDVGGDLHEWAKVDFPWNLAVDPTGTRMTYVYLPGVAHKEDVAGEIHLVSLSEAGISEPRLVGRHDKQVTRTAYHPSGSVLASADDSGEVRLWDLESSEEAPLRILRQPPPTWVRNLRFSKAGSQLAAATWSGHVARWDLAGPPDADPTLLRRGETGWTFDAAFHPDGRWLATGSHLGVALWPIVRRYPLSLNGHESAVRGVAFLPDGSALASVSTDGTLRLWPLTSAVGERGGVLFETEEYLTQLAVGPSSRRIVVGTPVGSLWMVPIDGSPARSLKGSQERVSTLAMGLDEVAAVVRDAGSSRLRVWDIVSGEYRDLENPTQVRALRFTSGHGLHSIGPQGLRAWNLAEGSAEVLWETVGRVDFNRPWTVDLDGEAQIVLTGNQGENGEAVLHDLESQTSRPLEEHGPARCGGLDPGGRTVVTLPCDGAGHPQVSDARGGSAHLLVSKKQIRTIEISPDGTWLAALGADDSHTITLWPVPDLSEPPLHTLPRDELLAKLRALTNLRVVPDPESDTGWGWDLDPFPGWEEIPKW